MPFSYYNHPRHKLWSTILDIGEARLLASVQYWRDSEHPTVQRSLEGYCAEVTRCIGTCLEELGLPDSAISKITVLLGSVGLSLLELEAVTAEPSTSSSSQTVIREAD